MGKYESSLVLISSVDAENKNFGTGFVIDQDGKYSYILTCAHVVRDVQNKKKKVKVNEGIADVIAIGTPDGTDDLAVLQAEGVFGAPLMITRRNVGHKGLDFTLQGYQDAAYFTANGKKLSFPNLPLQGTLGNLITQRIPGQKLFVELWTLIIEDGSYPAPGYSGAPIVADIDGGEHVIGVLNMQPGKQPLAISIEVLDRVWPDQTYVRFINREDELKLILSSLAPAYYLLDAPAGYGKSTLLGELRKRFSEQKWSCAYLVLDPSFKLDEVAEAVAEKLSISDRLSSTEIHQDAGYRLGSALQSSWDNSQQGIVLLFDFDKGMGNFELLEGLLNVFIPHIQESLRSISPFESGDNRFRAVIAGRYLHSYYNRLSLQAPSLSPTPLYLTPFEYKVIHNSSINYLKNYRFLQIKQIAGHILYLTGGHPGCMAKILQWYKRSGMSPDTFLDKLSDKIWDEIVKPVVTSITDEFPTAFGVHKLMSNNVLRYMDYPVLRKLVDVLEISEVLDEFDLADKLTGAALLNWKSYLLHDDITRRLICLGLQIDKREEFIQQCQNAQRLCEERLLDGSTATPDKWAIEYLFQSLQQHAFLINDARQRQELRTHFISQELPKVLQWLGSGREKREQKNYLLRSIEEDWEFQFTSNYYLRGTEYNDDAIEELKAEVRRIL